MKILEERKIKNYREPDFYSCDDGRDELSDTDFDDAIESFYQDCSDDTIEVVTIFGFARVKPVLNGWVSSIQHVKACLDDDYGDPDGCFETLELDDELEHAERLLRIKAGKPRNLFRG